MPSKKILIFAPYGSWMVHHQLDAVIGAALVHRGCEVLVALCDGFLESCFIAGKPPNKETCRSCSATGENVFRAMNIRSIQLRSLITKEDKVAAHDFATTANPSQMESVTFEGYPLGKWCPPSMQGYFASANFPLDQEWAVNAIRDQFSSGALLVRVLNRLMDEFCPDQVFSYNSIHFYYQIASELAKQRGLPVLVHERGYLNDSFIVLDREHTNINRGRFTAFKAWEQIPLSILECNEVHTYYREREEGKNAFSRFYAFESPAEGIRSALRIPPDAPILALFGSGDRELGAMETVDGIPFAGQVDWIRRTAEICRKQGWYLVVRHHPSNVSKDLVNFSFLSDLMEMNREMPDCVRIIMPHEQISSYGLVWNADGAVTHFSTLGSEAIMRGVMGVCVGDSLYQIMGVEWASATKDYEKALVSCMEKTKTFKLSDLRRAYRAAHFIVFKMAYTFRGFGIRNTYGMDIRVKDVSELDRGYDKILDRVCDYVMEGSPLLPFPSAEDTVREDFEEEIFLNKEFENIQSRRRALKISSNLRRGDESPTLTVLALSRPGSPNPQSQSLARSREKSIEYIDVEKVKTGDNAGLFSALGSAVEHAKGRYIYISLPNVDVDESVFSTSLDFLELQINEDFKGVFWGAWIAGDDGKLYDEIFTEVRPGATFEEAIKTLPALMDPAYQFSLVVMRKDFLIELLNWLDAISGFSPTDIANSIFTLFSRTKSESAIKRMTFPMMSIYPEAFDQRRDHLLVLAESVASPQTAKSDVPNIVGSIVETLRPDELRARLEIVTNKFSQNPNEIGLGLEVADLLARLGEGEGARRALRAIQKLHPKEEARIQAIFENVEWKARLGVATAYHWLLVGKGYETLFSKKTIDSYSEARPYVESVPGWMLDGQEQFLFDKVKSLPDGAIILEMGADRGRSTSAMALACKGTNKRIFSIDSFSGNDGLMTKSKDFIQEWLGNLTRLGLESYVTPVQGYTYDVLPNWTTMVDFTFIDASHEYIDVLNDTRLIYPFVKKGGWLAFHDVEPGWPGPWRLWLEYGIPLLTDHATVHNLACGRKSVEYDFKKKPETVLEFSFSRMLIEDWRQTGDPSAIPILPALTASLDFEKSSSDGQQKAIQAESKIAMLAPHLQQTLYCMVVKDACMDGYLQYWYGLTLDAQGKYDEAKKHFTKAIKASYPVPKEQLRHRLIDSNLNHQGNGIEFFQTEISTQETVIQLGSRDGSLLCELPGRLKLGLEQNDHMRKHASLESGIDSFNNPQELPSQFADIIIDNGTLGLNEEPLALLKTLRQKLKPNGRIVFISPITGQDVSGETIYSWTAVTFKNLFSAAGFIVRDVSEIKSVLGETVIKLKADNSGRNSASSHIPDDSRMQDLKASIVGASIRVGANRLDPRDIPVALVVYRRSKHTNQVLQSLEKHGIRNLYIFCDAAKGNGDQADVAETQKLVESIGWVKPEVHRVENNRGLAKSIMAAVDHVLSKHETVVLLEDDCVPQPYFFKFMADALDKYRDDPKVFGISGYSVPIQPDLLQRYPYDLYFCPRISSWGWATWRHAWKELDRDLISVCKKALAANIDFDQGGSDIKHSIEGMLQGHVKDVWTLPWVLSVYLKQGCFVYPTVSHINNIGMDGTGVHCGKTEKYITTLSDSPARRFPEKAFFDKEFISRFRSFYDLVNH